MKIPINPAVNVLIPNGNLAPSLNVIQALKMQNDLTVRIICSDELKLAPGHYFCDKNYFIRFKNKFQYTDNIKKICHNEKVQIIIPTRPFDNILFSGLKDEFTKLGIHVPVSGKKTVSSV